MNTLKDLLRAACFAAEKHAGHIRKGAIGEPYINHPLEVARLIAEIGGVDDVEILMAALLHDTLEDCGVTEKELQQHFGDKILGYVREVTDDTGLPKAERKRLQILHAPHLSPGAKVIKLADKISNIIDVKDNPPTNWSIERRLEYVEWGVAVVAGLRGVNSELEFFFDELVQSFRKNLE